MPSRTTPRKAKATVDGPVYNQVDKDQITKNLLASRLASTVALAVDAKVGYILQGEGENQVPSLIAPDVEAASTLEKRATKIAARLKSLGASPEVDRIRAAHLVSREASIEQEHARWQTIADDPDLFDEPPKMVEQSLARLDAALATIREAQAKLPAALQGPDAVLGMTEADTAAAQARKDLEVQAAAQAEVESDEDEAERRRQAEADAIAADVDSQAKAQKEADLVAARETRRQEAVQKAEAKK